MKFLSLIGFLFLVVVFGIVSRKSQKFQLDRLTGTKHSQFVSFLLSSAVFLIQFVQFWLLTRIFPLVLVAALMGAWAIALVINSLIGAIAGIGVKEKREKIEALTFIWSTQQQATGCLLMTLSLLAYAALLIGTLRMFWIHPIGDVRTRVWIAILMFIFPVSFDILSSFLMSWRLLSSEFVDDDLRNSFLSGAFSKIISQIFTLFFPIWMIRNDFSHVFGKDISHFWLLLSIPLLSFLLGSLLPFMIGLHRFRAQEGIMDRWQEHWLRELLASVQLPDGPQRVRAMQESKERLDYEIEHRFSDDPIFKLYEGLQQTREEEPEMAPGLAIIPSVDSDAGAATAPTLAAVPDVREEASLRIARRAAEILRGAARLPQRDEDDPLDQLKFIVQKYQSRLVEWDIRFAYLWNLLQLRELIQTAKTGNVTEFVKTRLENLKSHTEKSGPGKNILAATFTGALSSLLVFLFKTYQHELFNLIGALVKKS